MVAWPDQAGVGERQSAAIHAIALVPFQPIGHHFPNTQKRRSRRQRPTRLPGPAQERLPLRQNPEACLRLFDCRLHARQFVSQVARAERPPSRQSRTKKRWEDHARLPRIGRQVHAMPAQNVPTAPGASTHWKAAEVCCPTQGRILALATERVHWRRQSQTN